jgi:RNA polymerase sigma factor (sigma-70 family)
VITTVEDLLRSLAPQVLAPVARRSGDFDAAEDAVQEALIAAANHWPREGIPDDPRAWLVRAAGNRLIDQRRSDDARSARELRLALAEPAPARDAIAETDDTLAVLLMCCHPSLTPGSAIALTLRAVGGLTTAEIARAFLVPEPTMAQRISRAKQAIRSSGEPFRLPPQASMGERVRLVLHVLYLVFNEGYASSGGAYPHRADLSDEAIRLARLAVAALPGDAEAEGLLSLMLLLDARRPARVTANGDPVPMPDQDRACWDRARIGEGLELLDRSIARGRVGEYQLQAAIAAVHDRAATADATDWAQILALYGLLEQMTGNPVVTLNRAVAAGMAEGAAAGLAILDGLAAPLTDHHRFHAVRAHLLELAGDAGGAVESYRMAARRATNLAEQRHLAAQAARLVAGGSGPPGPLAGR